MRKKNRLIKKIQNLQLNIDEIEEIIDSSSATDEIVDFIAKKYNSHLNSDEFQRVNDIINLFDLTKFDESNIKLSKAAKRSFFSLIIAGELSRSEIIYFIKNDIAKDVDIINALKHYVIRDLADITLRWKPYLLENLEAARLKMFNVTKEMIHDSKQRALKLEKFKFMSE